MHIMATSNNTELVERTLVLLRESLIIWRTAGEVRAGPTPTIAIVCPIAGNKIYIDMANCDEAPVRWWVRWDDQQATRPRTRPCTSIVGLLRAVRNALGVSPGLRAAVIPNSVSSV